jgi:hypothetical protein
MQEIKEMQLLRALGMKIKQVALLYNRNVATVWSSTYGFQERFPAQHEWAQKQPKQ